MMVLVDTSIWIDHLRFGDDVLRRLLIEGNVISHIFITGEVAMGSIKERKEVLASLQRLPTATAAMDSEVLQFIDEHSLYGAGISYIDAHLLVSARLSPEVLLWTRDKRLVEIAARMNLAYMPADEPIQ